MIKQPGEEKMYFPRNKTILTRNYTHFIKLVFILLFYSVLSFAGNTLDRPNILWIVSEDNSPFLGCYGDKKAVTPNLDRLAGEGIAYDNAFANAPVCAPMRNTIITGVYASQLGCQNMRSKYAIPERFKFLPQYLREAGYYCTNNAKEDYNTIKPENCWDESSSKAHYMNRKAGQPFFAVFNTNLSHEHKIHFTSLIDADHLQHKPEEMLLAPYHPDLPEMRQCYATYYDYVTKMDEKMGELLAELEKNGLADETIVFYYSDHGGVMPRSKRFLFESGTKIPFIIRFPEKYQYLAPAGPGERENRMISLVDLAPTLLSLAGIKIPAYLSGHAFLGEQKTADPAYVYFFRQRMDERYDMMRAVRDKRFRYIRNYLPHRKYGEHLSYLWRSTSTRAWEAAFLAGKCNDIQSRFWGYKAPEELYDVTVDPHNVHNLANDPAYNDDLVRMRKALKRWVRENHDAGFLHEGLMIELAGGQTIYELTHAPDYPNERIIETAEMASDTNPDHMPALITRLADPHPAVRFWAAAGFAVPGARVKEAVPALKKLLVDPVADVRITAAEALCKAGEKKESQALLIGELENENPRVQLYALNVLDALGNDTQAVMKELFLAAMNRKERDEYFQRAYMHLIQTLKPGWEDYIVW